MITQAQLYPSNSTSIKFVKKAGREKEGDRKGRSKEREQNWKK